jgi:hypothetical protein
MLERASLLNNARWTSAVYGSRIVLRCSTCLNCRLGLLFLRPQVKAMLPRLMERAQECESELGNLYPVHTEYWWPIIEDIFSSPKARRQLRALP